MVSFQEFLLHIRDTIVCTSQMRVSWQQRKRKGEKMLVFCTLPLKCCEFILLSLDKHVLNLRRRGGQYFYFILVKRRKRSEGFSGRFRQEKYDEK